MNLRHPLMLSQKTSSNTRTITLTQIHNNYDPSTGIGNTYQVVIWMVPQYDPNGQLIPLNPPPSVTFTDKQGSDVTGCSFNYRADIGATIASVPVTLASGMLAITHSVTGNVNGVSGSSITNGVNGAH